MPWQPSFASLCEYNLWTNLRIIATSATSRKQQTLVPIEAIDFCNKCVLTLKMIDNFPQVAKPKYTCNFLVHLFDQLLFSNRIYALKNFLLPFRTEIPLQRNGCENSSMWNFWNKVKYENWKISETIVEISFWSVLKWFSSIGVLWLKPIQNSVRKSKWITKSLHNS